MSRCIACNVKLSGGELKVKNKHTGMTEDMCRRCIDLSYDTSIIYDDEGEEVGRFNEALLPNNVGSLATVQGMSNTILHEGSLTIDLVYT